MMGRSTPGALKVGQESISAFPRPATRPVLASNRGHVAFYPGLSDCFVDDECKLPQAGGFYGGWIASHVVGPFKGAQGTKRW